MASHPRIVRQPGQGPVGQNGGRALGHGLGSEIVAIQTRARDADEQAPGRHRPAVDAHSLDDGIATLAHIAHSAGGHQDFRQGHAHPVSSLTTAASENECFTSPIC